MTNGGLAILAGGENSRLQPLAGTAYKAFLPIHGASLLARHVLQAQLHGFTQAVVVTDESDPLVHRAFLGHPSMSVRHRVLQGTGAEKIAAVARDYADWRPLIVCLGDTFVKVDLSRLAAMPRRLDVDSVIVVARYKSPFGVVSVGGDARVLRFSEKPVFDALINVGVMALGELALDAVARSGDLATALDAVTSRGQLGAMEVQEPIATVDDLSGLARAHEVLRPTDEAATT